MCKVLVLDDESVITDLVCRVVEDVKPLSCLAAHTEAEARKLLLEHDVGIAIVDLILKQPRAGSGFNFARHVRQVSPSTVIVAFTGFPQELYESDLLTVIDDYLFKPASMERLSAKLITWYINHGQKEELDRKFGDWYRRCSDTLSEVKSVRAAVEELMGTR